MKNWPSLNGIALNIAAVANGLFCLERYFRLSSTRSQKLQYSVQEASPKAEKIL